MRTKSAHAPLKYALVFCNHNCTGTLFLESPIAIVHNKSTLLEIVRKDRNDSLVVTHPYRAY